MMRALLARKRMKGGGSAAKGKFLNLVKSSKKTLLKYILFYIYFFL